MPKRTAEEKLKRYKEKIRKIEQNLGRSRRHRIRRLISSSEEEDNEAELNGHDTDMTPPGPPPLAGQNPGPQEIFPVGEPVTDVLPTTITENVPTSNVSLDPVLMAALGANTAETPSYGKNIHDSLTGLWTPILRKGISKDEKDKLAQEYLVPENCKMLQAPTLNAEISAAVSDVVRGRDKKHLSYQQQLGHGTTAVNRAMDLLLLPEKDNKVNALKHLSDACRIFTDLHHNLTLNRIKLITPSLEKNFLNVITDVERDEYLFGESLGEKIKASRAIEKQGTQIRKPVTSFSQLKTRTSRTGQSSAQGNWAGPPRYPGSRGGRGGQRRYGTATTTTPRHTYQHYQTRAPSRGATSQHTYRPRAQQ